MTPEAQRIAIAEACGWIGCYYSNAHQTVIGRPPNWDTWPGIWLEKSTTVAKAPDYLNDLNAIHEAEKILTKEQHWKFINELCRLTGAEWTDSYEEVMRVAHATAAQRSEAVLFTLGKWDDTK